jgi:hypothetical protein
MPTTTRTTWTFDTLARADRPTLERVLLDGPAPDPEQLEGFIYCGWNHEWVGRLSGEKFKKGFRKRQGKHFGYNELVRQDNQGHQGEWEVKLKDGRPVQLGYFRVSNVADEPPQPLYEPYTHLGHFNYDVEMNTGRNLPFRVIRDFVVLPNRDDHELMLCKAYLQLGLQSVNVFYCYFLLGHRQPLEHEPW